MAENPFDTGSSLVAGFNKGAGTANETVATGMKWAELKNNFEYRQQQLQMDKARLEQTDDEHKIQKFKAMEPYIDRFVSNVGFAGVTKANEALLRQQAAIAGLNYDQFIAHTKDVSSGGQKDIGRMMVLARDPNVPQETRIKWMQAMADSGYLDNKSFPDLVKATNNNLTTLIAAQTKAEPFKERNALSASTTFSKDPILLMVEKQRSGIVHASQILADQASGKVPKSINIVKETASTLATALTQTGQTTLAGQERNDWIAYEAELQDKFAKLTNRLGDQSVDQSLSMLAHLRDSVSEAVEAVGKNRELSLIKKQIPVSRKNSVIREGLEAMASEHGMTLEEISKWKPSNPFQDLSRSLDSELGLEEKVTKAGPKKNTETSAVKPIGLLDLQENQLSLIRGLLEKKVPPAKIEEAIGRKISPEVFQRIANPKGRN